MRNLVTIRPLSGEPYPLVIDDGRFGEAEGSIDQELDTAGLWALPGLADCHAHLAADGVDHMIDQTETDHAGIDRRAADQVRGGVLLILDKGAKDNGVVELRHSPPPLAPVIRAAGRMITAPGGYYPDFAWEVEPGDLGEAVTDVAHSADWVKIVGDWPRKGEGAVINFDQATLIAAADAAHRAGARIAIHTTAPHTPGWAVQAGFDSIEHGLYLNEDDLAVLGAAGGAWVPTVVAMEGVVDLLGEDSSGGKMFTAGLGNVRDLLPAAAHHGVRVLAGTDLTLGHGSVAREALRLYDYGLAPAEAVAAVSTNAFDYAGLPFALQPGDEANVVFFEHNPVEHIETLLRPVLIIRAGQIVERP